MGALFGGIGGFFAFAAFVLLVFSSVSTPVWDKVYFLSATIPDGSLRFGCWGACIDGAQTVCTSRTLGYRLDDIVSNAGGTGGNDASDAIIHGLTYALVLVPIAAGISFIAFLLALVASLFTHILGSIVAFLAFLVAVVAFGFELGIFVTAKHRFEDVGISASYGNALWFNLAAVVCLLIAFFTICCSGLHDRRQRRYGNATADPVYEEKRGMFWNRRSANTTVV